MGFLYYFLHGVAFLFIVLCLRFLKHIVDCHRAQQIFKKHGIPGPKPNLLFGNFHQMRKREDPNEILDLWIEHYGNVFGYFVGDRPHLVINDVDILKDIMIRYNRIFTNRLPFFIPIMPMSRSVVAVEGEEWRNQRKVITPAFSPSKLRLLTDSMNNNVSVLLEELGKLAHKEESFDIYEHCRTLTLETIAQCALAMDIGCQSNLQSSFFKAVKDFFDMAMNPVVTASIIFPPLKNVFAFLNNYLTSGQMTDVIVRNTKKVIQQRRKESTRRTDLLQILLDSADEFKKLTGDEKYHMDDYCAMANAFVFLLAGYETTSTMLAFTFYLLSKHQDVQERLYNEVREHVGDGQSPSYDLIAKMQYLDQVVNESLRMYPPITLFITRVAEEDCEINGLKIPKGVAVQVPVWHIHHDPAHYPDPWEFKPDRFSPENKNGIHPAAFTPFGVGPRNCIGMRFALLEAKLTIARVINRYRLTMTSQSEDPLVITCPTVISYPKNGVFVKATFR